MAWYQFWKSGVIAADEAWVVKQLNSLSKGVRLIEADIDAAVNWIMSHQAEILKDIAALISVATVAGLNANPAVAAVTLAANEALAAVAAYQARRAAGATSVSAIQAAYQATKDAQIAHAEAAKAVAADKPVAASLSLLPTTTVG